MATKYYNLNQAVKHRTSTGLIPFVIAYEVRETYRDGNGQEAMRNRVYYAFDDIKDFLDNQNAWPHAHEVVWDRLKSGTQQGRLVFDFDFDEPWAGVKPNFVIKDFELRIQEVVVATFNTYYQGVDTGKFVWVWLVSDTEHKWSKHLVVKNAYFSHDWKMQIATFYNLFLSTAAKSGHFPSSIIDKLIDTQVARAYGTMRICGSSKIGGKVLRLESPEGLSIEDTMIQLYNYKAVKAEQHIAEAQLRKDVLSDAFFDHPEVVMKDKHMKMACEKCYIDLSSYYDTADMIVSAQDANEAFALFSKRYCEHFGVLKQDVFRLGRVQGNFIPLVRCRPAPCWLSGRIHEAENACLVVSNKNVLFYCRRDCTTADGKKTIGLFK